MKTRVLVVGVVLAAVAPGYAARNNSQTMLNAGKTYIGHSGDIFRVPSAQTECKVSAEGGATNVICTHIRTHRYEVYFYKDNILVYRVGNPDKTVWSAKGRP